MPAQSEAFQLVFSDILAIIQTASVVLAIILTYSTLRGRQNDKASDNSKMHSDIEHVVSQVDKIDTTITQLVRDVSAIDKLAHTTAEVLRNHLNGKE